MVIRLKSILQGAKIPGNKNTASMQTVIMPVPDEVSIIMTKHMGIANNVSVNLKDYVYVGQVIGTSENINSVPMHSSVSGTVKSIENIAMPDGYLAKTVVIETDKKQALDPSIKPPVINNFEDFLDTVKKSGMVGLGGAGFPTHVKFNPSNLEEIDTLLINAAECEPYLTYDTRTIIEDTENLFHGINVIMENMKIDNCVIGVEDNKLEAIEILIKEAEKRNNITIAVVEAIYPQGAEKVLIKHTLGRDVFEGDLPADAGVTVINVTTASELGRFFKDGIPLTNKRITMDGDALKNPQNMLVPIGATIKSIVDACGGYKETPRKILMGGPMMGISVYSDGFPIIKNNNGILVFTEKQAIKYAETPCIRCGRCTRVCPMNLVPFQLKQLYESNDVDGLKEYKINLCIECGNCAYVCPAKQDLVQSHRMSKQFIRKEGN